MSIHCLATNEEGKMKTGKKRPGSINIITLGCAKNLYDSEILMGQLRASGIEARHEDEGYSDVTIINTCGFIGDAKQESIDMILEWVDAKKEGKTEKLYVMGCLSERYRQELEKDIPEVDAWFGTRELPRLLKSMNTDYKRNLVGERLLTTPVHYAYLKISEGCDRTCSFCAIPLMRGGHRSVPMERLVEEAQKLAAKGTRELLLIAQDLTYYGIDIYGKRTLARLLDKLAGVEGIEWIRLHYAYPSQFPVEVLDVINEHSNICNYLDIPLQHASDRMLKRMKRMINREKTDTLIRTIREKVPGIAIRTTLISGFPGETEKDHEELLRWVESMRFDRLGVFAYSHEEDTAAFQYADDIPDEVKQKRVEEIMELQSGISYAINEQKIGKTYKVLIDREERSFYFGRTEFDSPEVDNEVIIPKSEGYLRVGDFVNAEIVKVDPFDLYGKITG